jgi:uncharacterized protein YggE
MSAELVRTVTVTGSANVAVKPDRAALSLGVQSRRPRAHSAMRDVDERAAALLSALRDAGARDEDLRTTGLSLWFDQNEREYVTSYNITVGVGSDEVGRFIDAATEVTGEDLTMNGVSFAIEDPAPLLAPLRELAVADAQAKAKALAAAADCELGPVVTIVEGGGGATPVLKGGAGMRMAMAAPIEAGTEVLTLQVSVTYELVF